MHVNSHTSNPDMLNQVNTVKNSTLLFLACAALFPVSLANACSYSPSPLLQIVELGYTDHIVGFRVTGYEDREEGFPRYMEGEVIRQWRGTIEESTIRIYGGDGLACIPYVTEFTLEQEWLLPLSKSDGIYRLSAFTQPIAIENGTATGFISTLNCPADANGNRICTVLSPDELTEARTEQMTLTEFERALQLYSDGIAWALRLCEGPSVRCGNIRPSYDSQSGVLNLPTVDVISSPFNYGISAIMQLVEGTDSTFEVTEVD